MTREEAPGFLRRVFTSAVDYYREATERADNRRGFFERTGTWPELACTCGCGGEVLYAWIDHRPADTEGPDETCANGGLFVYAAGIGAIVGIESLDALEVFFDRYYKRSAFVPVMRRTFEAFFYN
ncbi:MAG TPA: hypothetical protein VF183_07335 [Acidimicrobiales bacterium]